MALPTITVAYTPSWAGAITRNLEARLEDTLHAADFGVNTTNTPADNNTRLQNAIDAAVSLGAELILPPGDLPFMNLTIGGSNVIIRGAGSTRLVSSDTGKNLITIGNGVTQFQNVHLRDFSIYATANVGSGFAIVWKRAARCSMQNIKAGRPEDDIVRLAGGVHFDGFNECVIRDCLFFHNSGEGILINGSGDWKAELVIDGHTLVSDSGSNGIHIAGDAGGVYLVSGGAQASAANGVIVNTSANSIINREIFSYTGFCVDSNSGNGYLFEANSCSTFNGTGGWSNGNGNVGIHIKSGQHPGAKFLLNGFIASDNLSHGVYHQGGHLSAVGCQFARNGIRYSSATAPWGMVTGQGDDLTLVLVACDITNNGNTSGGGGLLLQTPLPAFNITGNMIISNSNSNITSQITPTPTAQVMANNSY